LNNPLPHEQNPQSNDDIDLLKLLKSVAATWKHWLIALIVVSALYGAVKAFQISVLTQEITYSKPIRLTFPNAHKLKFPSGARFAYSDIVSPSVIRIAYDRNNIKDYDVSISELQAALTAAPYSPQYPLIIKRYNILIANKKLTPDQVNELQKQMEQEIEQATSGEALISLRLEKKELPKDVANKLLNDIPAIWAENAVKQKGVLKVNVQLASANSINKDLILNEDPLIASDIIGEKLQALKLNINKLGEFEGAQPIADPVTGMKIQDLTYAVDDMGNYLLGSVLAPARELGLTESPQKTIYYYQDRIKKLSLQLHALNKKANSIKTIYDSYTQNSLVNSTPAANNSAALSEINLDLVDKLVSLSGDVDRQKYRQRLHAEWIKLVEDISDLESTIQDAEQILSAVKKSASTQQTVDQKNFTDLARREIPILLDKLVSFYHVSERIYSQLSTESVGVSDQLYIPVTHVVLSNRNLMDTDATLMIWIALMFLTTILVIPAVMIRNALKLK